LRNNQTSEFLTSNNYFIDNQQDNVTGRGNKNVITEMKKFRRNYRSVEITNIPPPPSLMERGWGRGLECHHQRRQTYGLPDK
jgi:hypothetical protein